ncbi:LysR family transcriptional regulator [Leminorella grimontii]|uniref:LysR family transcriptional regulator n=1 Tax=Leminorella grimontii TaxID=82981 RepID=A4FRA5_9GAMM|nr:LysR family transcriptional regulator [Leminorella grimontii]KFC93115.1 AmpR family transcriptional activator [Leminorella grimontii ATCC 33999 = DSM 5078]GKX57481.1 LysR family transcriptional regulator [Leminorella grimontii]CAM12802.1 transcriptional regulator LysR [Leminorella grimontii ATCC 33999 = DSM 5078]VFS62101.1 HTH-type transcriptional activator AmpR [Leminorella grimontii]
MRSNLPLNALRAFEASARHLSFTRAALELYVTQAAVSQQVRMLEDRLGMTLFKRLPRGLEMTDEAQALFAVLTDVFGQIDAVFRKFEGGGYREVLSVAAVGTFAVGWLFPRIEKFRQEHPFVELRLRTNNNVVNLAAEGLDFAIRFGAGTWPSTHNQMLLNAPLSALCTPETAERLSCPADLLKENLLRSYRVEEWDSWFAAAGVVAERVNGLVFDSSRLMVETAIHTGGVALAPPRMFARELETAQIVRPFDVEIDVGSYWLTHLKSKPMTPAMEIFRDWIKKEVAASHQ